MHLKNVGTNIKSCHCQTKTHREFLINILLAKVTKVLVFSAMQAFWKRHAQCFCKERCDRSLLYESPICRPLFSPCTNEFCKRFARLGKGRGKHWKILKFAKRIQTGCLQWDFELTTLLMLCFASSTLPTRLLRLLENCGKRFKSTWSHSSLAAWCLHPIYKVFISGWRISSSCLNYSWYLHEK